MFIYHYFFNYAVIPYAYSENLICYIESSIHNSNFLGQALKAKIIILENHFLTILKMTRYDPIIIYPIYCEIFYLFMV
ncbi:hypothetical protein R3W88_014884 [Solanum pinnatisectum]|uniref:Maturase K n=1 Tax=Solanum pinnatisectum TaxID=50273 RepID=A0AAV9KSV6_9SOLN|nr:hypothetical protein R3W88_014884 [Solanum pinnatisectum]